MTVKEITEGVDSDQDSDELNHLVIQAAIDNDPEQLARLLNKGADVNAQDDDGMSALHHAAANGSRACLRILIKTEDCDYSLLDNFDRSAAGLAIEWARDYAVGRLLSLKQVKQKSSRALTALNKLPTEEVGEAALRVSYPVIAAADFDAFNREFAPVIRRLISLMPGHPDATSFDTVSRFATEALPYQPGVFEFSRRQFKIDTALPYSMLLQLVQHCLNTGEFEDGRFGHNPLVSTSPQNSAGINFPEGAKPAGGAMNFRAGLEEMPRDARLKLELAGMVNSFRGVDGSLDPVSIARIKDILGTLMREISG